VTGPVGLGVTSSGVRARADQGHRAIASSEAFDRAIELALRGRVHLWIAAAAYVVTADGIDANQHDPAGHPLPLDLENLLSVDLGCLVCEEPYDPRLARRACPGEPKETR